MPVLVEQDTHRAARLAAGLPDGAHVVPGIEHLDNWLTSRPDEYAVVLGPDVSFPEAAGLARRLRATHPSAGLVLVRHGLSTEVFHTAMQAGIGSVVADNDGPALQGAVGRARETWEAIHGPARSIGGNGGRVITVFSPKGGVGKTTIAVNLALALSAGGAKRVCVVDLDLAFGDVAITLQLIPEHTIADAIGSEAHLDFSLLQRLLTRHQESLMILAAPTTPDARDRIQPSLARGVLTTLRRQFDYVVVDTSPGFDDAVLQALDETDELVLVATLDVPTVKNLKMAIDTLDALDLVKEGRHLVLNRADEQVGLTVDNVESIVKTKIAAAIPSDVAVATATNHGRPLVLAQPDHAVSRTMRGLADRLSVDAEAPGTDRPAAGSGASGRRRRFGRSSRKHCATHSRSRGADQP